MRIESSQSSYEATHRLATQTTVIDETLDRPGFATERAAVLRTVTQPVTVDTVALSGVAQASASTNRDDLSDMDPAQTLAALAIEALLGHRIRWVRLRPGASGNADAAGAARVTAGATQVHRRTEIRSESEQTTFQATGTVETADGRTIDFRVRLNLQRVYQSQTTVTAANTTDPLVVNFGGGSARLAGGRISFDLNSDGANEEISFVAAGSGFLALDVNDDGKVNDGRELFGPHSGNGFAELADYDSDGNGWIDEGDPVFSLLRIWTRDGLRTLPQQGIGALSTLSVETPFALKDGDRLLGEIRGTGVFLSEHGPPGTVQQVDLAGE